MFKISSKNFKRWWKNSAETILGKKIMCFPQKCQNICDITNKRKRHNYISLLTYVKNFKQKLQYKWLWRNIPHKILVEEEFYWKHKPPLSKTGRVIITEYEERHQTLFKNMYVRRVNLFFLIYTFRYEICVTD